MSEISKDTATKSQNIEKDLTVASDIPLEYIKTVFIFHVSPKNKDCTLCRVVPRINRFTRWILSLEGQPLSKKGAKPHFQRFRFLLILKMICFRCFQLWSTLTLCDHVFKQTPSGHAVCNLALRSHIIHKHLSNYTTWKTTKADTSVMLKRNCRHILRAQFFDQLTHVEQGLLKIQKQIMVTKNMNNYLSSLTMNK